MTVQRWERGWRRSPRPLLAMISIAIVAAIAVASCGGDPGSVRMPTPPAKLTARQAEKVHARLHRVRRICSRNRSGRARAAPLVQTVNQLLAFSRHRPVTRFRVHDETATTLSLMLVVRHELLGCSPSLARDAERAAVNVERIVTP